jgi:hypothetical protein
MLRMKLLLSQLNTQIHMQLENYMEVQLFIESNTPKNMQFGTYWVVLARNYNYWQHLQLPRYVDSWKSVDCCSEARTRASISSRDQFAINLGCRTATCHD